MKINQLLNLVISTFFTLALLSCNEPQVELKPISLQLVESENLQSVANLGKVLFYDKQLSLNNSISCASCHKQHLAFADNAAFSTGFENIKTLRNSMPIQDLGNSFNDEVLFWDGRENSLRSMVVQPIKNHIEMGFDDLNELSSKLASLPYYPELFQKASLSINPNSIASALQAFVQNINTRNTKFDAHLRNQVDLSAIEQEGRNLFITKYQCNACHQVQSSSGYLFAGVFANIGLEKEYKDAGLMNTTGNTWDSGKFKIPTLRNVELTAPYMHDGRFESLSDVLDHYSTGLEDNENLDARLRDSQGKALKPNLTESEKKAIISFLRTLTDHQMITNPKLSNPFN